MPASQPGLALTVDGAGTKNGTKILLAKDNKSDAQLWSLTKQDNGSYAIEPKHAPGMGLDHLGGKKEVGAKVDLWQHRKGDSHLQWFVRPLAGSGM
jgi:gluconolactonase